MKNISVFWVIVAILVIAIFVTLYMITQHEREMIQRGQEVSLDGAPVFYA